MIFGIFKTAFGKSNSSIQVINNKAQFIFDKVNFECEFALVFKFERIFNTLIMRIGVSAAVESIAIFFQEVRKSIYVDLFLFSDTNDESAVFCELVDSKWNIQNSGSFNRFNWLSRHCALNSVSILNFAFDSLSFICDR